MNKSELRIEWEQRMDNFISSGQSASKWCIANDINIHQFWYWKKRLKALQTQVTVSSKWLSVEMDDSTENSNNALIVRVGQASVEVKSGFDPKLLLDVVRTLRSIC
ncbi:IS66 family insertion sequence element accessory protein TnpB [Bacillus sp. CGMCC 1.16607]|uniref:IS66 family insertion sequence element accessory protein TnpA n=1 Tax=Bacillus sp. CGMCC 1.16607 TaxID=3351842 RepID=UPI003644D3F0